MSACPTSDGSGRRSQRPLAWTTISPRCQSMSSSFRLATSRERRPIRASNVMIGTLALAVIAGSFGAFMTWQKLAGRNQQIPFRVIFEGSASGLRKGGSVNFAGIRVGQVVSLKLDNPRRVIALAARHKLPVYIRDATLSPAGA